jgi:hypothetical protein
MKIFVSYSFRAETRWVDDYVIPLIRCFGHEPVTGRILDGGSIPDEVRRLIKSTKRVLCFVTRAKLNHGEDRSLTSYAPPDWVRDELMMSRGADKTAIEFREKDVEYEGAAPFSAFHAFDRAELPALLLELAEILKDWPVGPLTLRLTVPPGLQDDFGAGVDAGTLQAKCTARDSDDNVVFSEVALVRRRQPDQFVIPILIKPDPNLAIEIDIAFGPRSRLVCTGISPTVCMAPLRQL